ncbi:hypothetical protein ACFLZ2_05620 [Candidatus Margulisiibacteriota bacterium]
MSGMGSIIGQATGFLKGLRDLTDPSVRKHFPNIVKSEIKSIFTPEPDTYNGKPTSPDQPTGSKITLANAMSWVSDKYNSLVALFTGANDTKAAVDAAIAAGDKEGAGKIAGDHLAEQGVKGTEKMSADEKIALLDKYRKYLGNLAVEQGKNILSGNFAKFKASHEKFEAFVATLTPEQKNALAPEIGNVVSTETEGCSTFTSQNKAAVAQIGASGQKTEAEQTALNAVAAQTKDINNILASNKVIAEEAGVTQEVQDGIQVALGEVGETAASIIEVADAKGYTLSNYAALASIAGDTASQTAEATAGYSPTIGYGSTLGTEGNSHYRIDNPMDDVTQGILDRGAERQNEKVENSERLLAKSRKETKRKKKKAEEAISIASLGAKNARNLKEIKKQLANLIYPTT